MRPFRGRYSHAIEPVVAKPAHVRICRILIDSTGRQTYHRDILKANAPAVLEHPEAWPHLELAGTAGNIIAIIGPLLP